MVTFDPKKLADELIQFVPSRFGELYPASPDNEEKPSLADSLEYKVKHLRTRQHMPTGQRTVGHKKIDITPNFLSSPRGREVVSTISYLTQQKLLTRNQTYTEEAVARYMESESREPGDVTAELIYCLKPKAPKREMTNLVSQLLAFEKLRKCVREECHTVLLETQTIEKECSQIDQETKHNSEKLTSSTLNGNKIEELGLIYAQAAMRCMELQAKQLREAENREKTTEKYGKILQSLIGMETAFFPPALQVKKLTYSILNDKSEIAKLSSHINSENPLFFRFLILNKNQASQTSISAYFHPTSETSFIYIPSLGKFWYFQKRDFFDELIEVLNSRFKPEEKETLEMTIWRQEAVLAEDGSSRTYISSDTQESSLKTSAPEAQRSQGLPPGVGSMVTTTTTILSADAVPPLASTSYVYPTVPVPCAPPLPPAYLSSSSTNEEASSPVPTNRQAKQLVEA